MQGWIDLFVNRILADVVGPKAAPVVFSMICAFLALAAAMPFLMVLVTRQVVRVRAALALAEEKLDRIAQRHLEMHAMVKESFALVQERLSTVPPPVRFGPADTEKAPPAEGGGQGSYNYCPGCKEIRFIKFLRCQTCGYHVTPGK